MDALALIEPLKADERPSSSRTPSVASRQSIHVAVPPNVRPGEKFFVVVDDMEYEVIAPEDCMPGEMIAMDIMSDLRYWETDAPAVVVYPDPDDRGEGGRPGPGWNESKEYEASVAESVATDASIVQITVPNDCNAGDTFFAAVNGLEYEILVPKGSNPGDVITLEVPSKHAVGKFAVPAPATDVPSILVRDAMASQGSSETDVFAEISVPENTYPGQTFVAVIENMEFEVPVPEARLIVMSEKAFPDSGDSSGRLRSGRPNDASGAFTWLHAEASAVGLAPKEQSTLHCFASLQHLFCFFLRSFGKCAKSSKKCVKSCKPSGKCRCRKRELKMQRLQAEFLEEVYEWQVVAAQNSESVLAFDMKRRC